MTEPSDGWDERERLADKFCKGYPADRQIYVEQGFKEGWDASRSRDQARIAELTSALQKIQVCAMEGQLKCEKYLPGHPIVGLLAEFEIMADKALKGEGDET